MAGYCVCCCCTLPPFCLHACLPTCSFKACTGEESNLLVMPCWQKDDPSDTMVGAQRAHPCPCFAFLWLACHLLHS